MRSWGKQAGRPSHSSVAGGFRQLLFSAMVVSQAEKRVIFRGVIVPMVLFPANAPLWLFSAQGLAAIIGAFDKPGLVHPERQFAGATVPGRLSRDGIPLVVRID